MNLATLDRAALFLLLALPLALSPFIGLLTPYLSLAVIVPAGLVVLFRRGLRAAYGTYEAASLLAVFVIFAVLFTVTADSASDALRAFNFTMLLAYGPVARFLGDRASAKGPEHVVQLASLGVAVGLLQVVLDALSGSPRPEGINIGPIVLANGLLALGFIAAGAALFLPGRRGISYLAAPAAAIVATIITGSRGPLVAVPFLALLLACYLWRHRFGANRRALLPSLVVLVLLGLIGAAALATRGGSIVAIGSDLLGGTEVTDETTGYRFALYEAGWQAFLQSPWIGHGWANIMPSVQGFLTDEMLRELPQLHNDVLNFAVAAGVIGVAAYIVIVTAPLVGACLGPRDSLRTFHLYAASVLVITYIGGGLTDLMFGFEFHTWLFGMLTAIVLGYCRDRPAVSGAGEQSR